MRIQSRLVSTGFGVVLCAAAMLVLTPTRAAVQATITPADYARPSVCPDRYDLTDDKASCKPNDAEIGKLVGDACIEPTYKKDGGTCKAASPAPPPQCKPLQGYKQKIVGSGASATCTYELTAATSAAGDYIGDCIRIRVAPPGSGLQPNAKYFVSGQKAVGEDDRELTLVEGKVSWFPLRCKAIGNTKHQASASELMEGGALRQGYTYGLLTMPYKYFPRHKSFVVNAPLGAYVGWRGGQAGSGWTVAGAFTLSSVKADTVDPKQLDASGQPVVTGSTDVSALSGAVGLMFDLLKSPRGKPFKAGLFFGRDVVSKDPSIVYKYNRTNWFALQLGYDFTDN